jgi:hypothetical protein
VWDETFPGDLYRAEPAAAEQFAASLAAAADRGGAPDVGVPF